MSDKVQFYLDSVIKSATGLQARIKDLNSVNTFELVPVVDFLTVESRKQQLKFFTPNQMITLLSWALGNDKHKIVVEDHDDKALLALSMMFCSIILISSLTSHREVELFGYTMSGAVLLPLSSFITSIITEVYGFKKIRWVFFIALIAALLLSLNVWLVMAQGTDCGICGAFDLIANAMLSATGAYILSLLAGIYVNAYLIAYLKSRFKFSLARRIFLAVMMAILVESLLFVPLTFGIWDSMDAILLTITRIFDKTCYVLVLLYPTILLCSYIKRQTRIDIYDLANDFSPWAVVDTAYLPQYNAWNVIKHKD